MKHLIFVGLTTTTLGGEFWLDKSDYWASFSKKHANDGQQIYDEAAAREVNEDSKTEDKMWKAQALIRGGFLLKKCDLTSKDSIIAYAQTEVDKIPFTVEEKADKLDKVTIAQMLYMLHKYDWFIEYVNAEFGDITKSDHVNIKIRYAYAEYKQGNDDKAIALIRTCNNTEALISFLVMMKRREDIRAFIKDNYLSTEIKNDADGLAKAIDGLEKTTNLTDVSKLSDFLEILALVSFKYPPTDLDPEDVQKWANLKRDIDSKIEKLKNLKKTLSEIK